MTARALSICAVLACSVGCAQATVRSGRPPAETASAHHDKWHASFLFGALELSGPYDLARLCSRGWAEVHVGPDPFTIFATVITLGIYSPARVTVVCAAETPHRMPALNSSEPPTSTGGARRFEPAPPPPESF